MTTDEETTTCEDRPKVRIINFLVNHGSASPRFASFANRHPKGKILFLLHSSFVSSKITSIRKNKNKTKQNKTKQKNKNKKAKKKQNKTKQNKQTNKQKTKKPVSS